jgi:NAD(P)H-dependent flavin oxidoreductase YrpB (nitropropane dioxygenase family)
MIRTPACNVLRIEHPIAIGGMGSVYSPPLVAAVSNAGALGAMALHDRRAGARRHGGDPRSDQ